MTLTASSRRRPFAGAGCPVHLAGAVQLWWLRVISLLAAHNHGSWFELAYVLTDDFGMLIFVADHPDTNHSLRFNCLGFANRPSTPDKA